MESSTDSADSRERHSVSELVRSYGDVLSEGHGGGKRDRSESGDHAPAGKRGAPEPESRRSPAPHNIADMKEYLEVALEKLENRITASISNDLHEFRELVTTELGALTDRVRDLERHVEERDLEVERLTSDLATTKKELKQLQDRAENAEMNARIPCLVLSGRAMAPRHAPRLDAPLQPAGQAVPRGGDPPGAPSRAESAGARAGASGVRGGPAGGDGRAAGEAEDIYGLVIGAVRARLPGLDVTSDHIDRAHRLPGPNNRVIVRFVHSGPGSVRDQLMTRRLELRGHNDLFINESLTTKRSQIYRSLLDAKKASKIYTVFTRWGHVHFKREKFGTSTRVDTVEKLRELGLPVKE